MSATSAPVCAPLRALFDVGALGAMTDELLLERALQGPGPGESEAAWTALIARHGPMVRAVCTSRLDDPHDVDDAFQATFLVLARRARSIRNRGSLGGWLFGVARRVSRRAREDASRRRDVERRAAEARNGPSVPVTTRHASDALIEEVDRLPARSREVVVLCHLEGLTIEEAASRIGCPRGTVLSRLARARDRLRDQLRRRGFSTLIQFVPAPLSAKLANATASALAVGGAPAGASLSALAVRWGTATGRALAATRWIIGASVALTAILAAWGFVVVRRAADGSPPPLLATTAVAAPKGAAQDDSAVPGLPIDDDGQGEHALSSVRVTVLDEDGQPIAAPALALWRRVTAEEKAATRSSGIAYLPFFWESPEDGTSWALHRTLPPDNPKPEFPGFQELAPGTYRVTVATHGATSTTDPTPMGVTVAFVLDGREAREVTVHTEGEARLEVQLVDAATQAPLDQLALRLLRASDGLPIIQPRDNGHVITRADPLGVARFEQLVPGAYQLQVLGRPAPSHDQPEYEPVAEPIVLNVITGRTNTFRVPLRGRPLTQAQVNEQWPYLVRGTVRDDEGRPLPGVDLVAYCGMGTLRQTGHTLSAPDGSYELRFRPGIHFLSDNTRWTQVATISARREGLVESNLNRHGNLLMGGPDYDDKADRPDYARAFEGVVVPGTPYPLDFTMVPAARVEGRLVDNDGQPLAGRSVWLNAEALPPSSNVLDSARTDDEGRFRFEGLRPGPAWFETRGTGEDRTEFRSEPFSFEIADTYRVTLTFGPGPDGTPQLVARPLESER